MAKYIELIDKYRIEQGDGDYNPPSYVWVDNTGEIVRCGECKYWNAEDKECKLMDMERTYGWDDFDKHTKPDWFCASGEREAQE